MLKYGGPTLTRFPLIASTSRGKVVPSRTVNVKATNNRLFRMNALSRETTASSEPGACRRSERQAMRTRDTIMSRAMKARKIGPIIPSVNA